MDFRMTWELKGVFASGVIIENMWLHQHYWALFGDIVSIVSPEARAPMSLFTSEYTLCPWLSLWVFSRAFFQLYPGSGVFHFALFFNKRKKEKSTSTHSLAKTCVDSLLMLPLVISGFWCIWAFSICATFHTSYLLENYMLIFALPNSLHLGPHM